MPTVNKDGSFNTQNAAVTPNQNGVLTPVVYHGGPTMTGGVTVHAIFWAPSGTETSFPTGPNGKSNPQMVEQYFTDVAAASTGTSGSTCTGAACNVFTVQPQYAQGTSGGPITSGANTVTYSTGSDAIMDTDPIPSGAGPNCTSPNAATYCITDQQVQAEVTNLINAAGGDSAAGLHNLWYVFLPPNVDECISPGACGTTVFGGYHSSFNIDQANSNPGTTQAIYAITIDPVIEAGSIAPGADPEGNPDAEVVLDIAAHETNEAMSDPLGTGYMNPNGWEVGDMCEFGPQRGTPLGFASDGSPYNQVVNTHQYLTQDMWSNDGDAANPTPSCVQGTNQTSNPLPLPQVNLTQFNRTVTGNIGKSSHPGGVGVTVSLVRADPTNINGVTTVDSASSTTDNSGNWSVTLPTHAVGDDRDEIDVTYSDASGFPGSAPTPNSQVILTGNGGNPFTASGWTGWTALDNGQFLTNFEPFPFLPNFGNPALLMGPCTQTGVLGFTINGTPQPSPTDYCNGEFDIADVPTSGTTSSDVVNANSNDNRAFAANDTANPNLSGGLVNLTVPVGEPDSAGNFPAANFPSTGFPTCTADLGMQTVTCSGLIPGNPYHISDGGQSATPTADSSGAVAAAMTIMRGNTITLSNGSRTLTTLRVANLQVSINDATPGIVSSGTCSSGEYWGGALNTEPTNGSAGEPTSLLNGGVADTGMICPGGSATGMPTPASQTDELSGGTTQVNLPDVADTSPMQGETVYGAFTALAEPTAGSPTIAVSIAHASGGPPVFSSANVDTANGSPVPALTPGTYKATWTVSDPNGDTRTMTSRFIEQSALQGPQGPPGPPGPQGPPGPKPKVKCKLVGKHHNKIKCKVTFPTHHAGDVSGKIEMRISRGAHVAALGHGQLRQGASTVTMRERRRLSHGLWRITLVLSGTGQKAQTIVLSLRIG